MLTRSDIRLLVLSLGAAAVALVGLLVPLHMALAHHCPAHAPAEMDSCAICLHWTHNAVEQPSVVILPSPAASAQLEPAAPCRAGVSGRLTIQVRGPPASV